MQSNDLFVGLNKMQVLPAPSGSPADLILTKNHIIDTRCGCFRFSHNTHARQFSLHSQLWRLLGRFPSCRLNPSYYLLHISDLKVQHLSIPWCPNPFLGRRAIRPTGIRTTNDLLNPGLFLDKTSFLNKVNGTYKCFTTVGKLSSVGLGSHIGSLVPKFVPDAGATIAEFANNFEALSLAALFTLACGAVLMKYSGAKQSRSKDLDTGSVVEEANVSFGRWMLLLRPTPFNRFVITRCPSISMNLTADLDLDVSQKLQLSSHQLVSLSTGMSQTVLTVDSCKKEIEVKDEGFYYNCKEARKIDYQRYCLPTQDGGVVALDWPRHLDLAGEHGLDTTLLLVPGTAKGSADEGLGIFVERALKNGYFPVVLNPRGCGGSPLTTPRIFAPGDSDDVRVAANFVTQSRSWATLMSIGWGFGANMLTKYLGEEGDATPVAAAVSIDNPFDLELATRHVEDRFRNHSRELTKGYVEILRSNKLLFQGLNKNFDVSKGLASTSLQEFDSAISMVAHGFEILEDFYSNASSVAFLQRVKSPLLCIQVDKLLSSNLLPHHLFKDNALLTLLSPSVSEAQMVPQELAFMTSAAPEQSNVVFEWLGAVEMALLKGRHPLLENFDLTINPAQEQGFKNLVPDYGGPYRTKNNFQIESEKRLHDTITGIGSEKTSEVSKSSVYKASEGRMAVQRHKQEYSEFGEIENTDFGTFDGIPKEQPSLQRLPVSNANNHLDHIHESTIINPTRGMEENEDTIQEESQKGQVRQALETVLNAVNLTMPVALSDQQKDQVLNAVERGETIVTALQGAVPADVRGKLIDAVFGAVKSRGISLELVGLGKGLSPPSLPEGVKEMIQEKLAAVAGKKHIDDLVIANKDEVINSDRHEPPNQGALDAQKALRNVGEDDHGDGQGTDQNQLIEVTSADGQSGSQNEEVTNGNLVDFKTPSEVKSDQHSHEENSPGSNNERERHEGKNMTQTLLEETTGKAEKDAKSFEERSTTKFEMNGPTNELKHAQNIDSGDPTEKQSMAESFKNSTFQMENKISEVNNQTEEKGRDVESDNIGKNLEVGRLSFRGTTTDHSATSGPSSSTFPPTMDVRQALEALTGFEDSTQVAVTNVFGVIENMIEQLEKDKEDNDSSKQNGLASLHGSTESIEENYYNKDSETKVSAKEFAVSKSGGREDVNFSSVSGGNSAMLSELHTSQGQNRPEVEPKCVSLLDKARNSFIEVLNPEKESDQQKEDNSNVKVVERNLHAGEIHKGETFLNMTSLPNLQENLSRKSLHSNCCPTENAGATEEISSKNIPIRHIDGLHDLNSSYQGIGAFSAPFGSDFQNIKKDSLYFESQRASPRGEQSEIHGNQIQQENQQLAAIEVMTLEDREPVASFIFKRNTQSSLSNDNSELGTLDVRKESAILTNEDNRKEGQGCEELADHRHSSNVSIYRKRELSTKLSNELKGCFSSIVYKLVMDALRSVILRRLGLSGVKALGAEVQEELVNITNAVAQAAHTSKWGHKPQMLVKARANKQKFNKLTLKIAATDAAKELQVLPVDVVVRAISYAFAGTVILQRLIHFGVVVGVILSALGSVFPIVEVEWEQEELTVKRNNFSRVPLESQDESSLGNLVIQESLKDLERNCNMTEREANVLDESKGASCTTLDVVGSPTDRDKTGTLSHNSKIMGAVAAAMSASAAYANNGVHSRNVDYQDTTTSTHVPKGQSQESIECKEVESNEFEAKGSFVSTIAEKAMSVAAPVVPTREDGKVDHDRLVALLVDLSQKGGALRFIGKAALLWGGLRGAMSLTDRLLVFFRISDRPLGERLLGFAGITVLLWSPIMIPLLPTLLQQWASRSPSSVAGCASAIGLYGAIIISITIWGKTIRGYEDPLEQYGLQIFSRYKV
ncbi:hypothetical protein O6H91_02G051900 [Diphasiastrum complanatum]|uniref:Uncharacterized protein n=1 Tax=Diphasiastrum complanatum TaxID=34168 RepID=A0ACC2EF83_DIPCM|nr:hypothetical protein O6H91_02G051900 [Diphasiastrum complanatum]